MKFAPDFPIDHKVKICICGKTKETFDVNKKKYNNAIFAAVFGGSMLFVGVGISPFAFFNKYEVSAITWIGAIIGWVLLGLVVKKTIRLVGEEHSLVCAIRRVVVDYAR